MRRILLLALLLIPIRVQAQTCVDPTPHILTDGYCEDGQWIPGLVSKATYWRTPPQFFSTRALFQARGLLEETARDAGYDGKENYIALLPPITAGWKAFIQAPSSSEWIPVRVVDVVKREDEYLEAVDMRAGLELSYALAEQLGDLNPPYLSGVKVCICDDHPDLLCVGTPVDFTAWYRSVLSFEGAV